MSIRTASNHNDDFDFGGSKNNGILDEQASERGPKKPIVSQPPRTLWFYAAANGSQCHTARGRHGWRHHVPREIMAGRTDTLLVGQSL